MSKIVLNGQSFEFRGPAGPDGNPMGTVISFMGLTAPKDYLVCDGSAYKISDYPDLAAFFKAQFGSETYFGGSGDTFAVPDMRNLFLRGYHGNASEMLSGDIGKKQEATVHQHVAPNGAGKLATYGENGASNADTDLQRYGIAYVTVNSSNNNLNTNLYTSRPVNMAVLYCIKAVKSESEKRDGGEVYSTEEIRIGTWIDGKPLYRRVYTGISAITTGEWWSPIQVDNASVITAFGWIVSNSTKMMIPNTQIRLGIIGGIVRFLVDNTTAVPAYNNKDYMFVVEYTKTTDTAPKAITSKVGSKSSGSIIHDGEQYGYELPDIVSTASSAAAAFNGVGSSAVYLRS